jgi:hypothetical protein
MFDVPIALLFYHRPELSRRVLATVRQIEPKTLLVVADGPRDPSEEALCQEVRSLFDAIDWPCSLFTNYATDNMGCARRIRSGLDWVFANVDRAIILEDDVLPDLSFFEFCRELLERYAEEERIMQISGTNMAGSTESQFSYGFSRFTLPPWGWASWARAWEKYDFSIGFWEEEKADIRRLLGATFEFWERIIEAYKRTLISWDLQWNATLWRHDGLTAVPSCNLVSNIGFGEGATHVGLRQSRYTRMETTPCAMPLNHPSSYTNDFDHLIEPRLIEFISEVTEFNAGTARWRELVAGAAERNR